MLPGSEIHVWQFGLVLPMHQIELDRKLLSRDEAERADRFRFEKHRAAFTIARSTLRRILSSYLGIPAEEIIFSYGPHGKPELAPFLQTDITFNLSHSRDVALLAVARSRRLGIDVEYVEQNLAVEEFAGFFSPLELQTLGQLRSKDRTKAFFDCWTLKEAYIKALGEGLALPLDSFSIAFGPGVLPRLLTVDESHPLLRDCSMYHLAAPQGYVAALVADGEGHRIRQLEWRREQERFAVGSQWSR